MSSANFLPACHELSLDPVPLVRSLVWSCARARVEPPPRSTFSGLSKLRFTPPLVQWHGSKLRVAMTPACLRERHSHSIHRCGRSRRRREGAVLGAGHKKLDPIPTTSNEAFTALSHLASGLYLDKWTNISLCYRLIHAARLPGRGGRFVRTLFRQALTCSPTGGPNFHPGGVQLQASILFHTPPFARRTPINATFPFSLL